MKKIIVLLSLAFSINANAQLLDSYYSDSPAERRLASDLRSSNSSLSTEAKATVKKDVVLTQYQPAGRSFTIAGDLFLDGNKFCSFPTVTVYDNGEAVNCDCGENQGTVKTYMEPSGSSYLRKFYFTIETSQGPYYFTATK